MAGSGYGAQTMTPILRALTPDIAYYRRHRRALLFYWLMACLVGAMVG